MRYLAELAARDPAALDAVVKEFTLRGQTFAPWPDVSLMGVVNLSADSRYRESIVPTVEAAIRRGRRLAAEGAKIVDVGAESSTLDSARLAPELQRQRLIPVVRELAAGNILVSVETYDMATARACLAAGAAVINLSAALGTEPFYQLAAEYAAAVIICFVEGRHARDRAESAAPVVDVLKPYEYFGREVERATRCGVRAMWLDPAIGFRAPDGAPAAVIRYQMETMLSSFRLRTLGWPVCQQLGDAFECFEEERRCGEPFFAGLALMGQADLLRTHEVAKVRGVLRAHELIP